VPAAHSRKQRVAKAVQLQQHQRLFHLAGPASRKQQAPRTASATRVHHTHAAARRTPHTPRPTGVIWRGDSVIEGVPETLDMLRGGGGGGGGGGPPCLARARGVACAACSTRSSCVVLCRCRVSLASHSAVVVAAAAVRATGAGAARPPV
jgi:hypothetical protein